VSISTWNPVAQEFEQKGHMRMNGQRRLREERGEAE